MFLIRAALEHADALLSMKHGLVRLDNVWGVGGGMRPVKYLINQVCNDFFQYLRCYIVVIKISLLFELSVYNLNLINRGFRVNIYQLEKKIKTCFINF